jgi:hypothetical protein
MAEETTPGDEPPAEDSSKKYDQEFFLALAAKGKDAWNAWRRDPVNNDVHVTFAGIDFSVAPRDKINFEGFEFGDFADFSRCKWRGVEWPRLGERLKLISNLSYFLPGRACFIAAKFGLQADFARAVFGGWATFAGATFDWFSNFIGSTFGNGAYFIGATFGSGAKFTGAAFGIDASFADTFFKGGVEFTGMSDQQWTGHLAKRNSKGSEAVTAQKQQHEESWTRHGSGPHRFSTISFENARFDGEAIFSGRSFERTADFTNARFYYPPDFDAVTNASRIDFTSAHIRFAPPGDWLPWTEDSQIPVRLRAFRKIAEETKNHDLERDLYIEERKAERGVYWRQLSDALKKSPEELKKKLEDITLQKKHAWLEWRLQRRARNAHWLGIAAKVVRLIAHGVWIAVMGVYWALSDYGRSFVRPFAWLIASGFFFYWRYLAVLAQLMAKAPDLDKYKQAVRMLTLGNTVPFVGPLTIDADIKKLLFCPSGNCFSPLIPPEGYQWLVIAQNLVSIILVFFIGLALRNYFRIK